MFVRSYSARLSWAKMSKKSLLVLFVLESLKAKTALPLLEEGLRIYTTHSNSNGRTVVSHYVLRMCQSTSPGSGLEVWWDKQLPICSLTME